MQGVARQLLEAGRPIITGARYDKQARVYVASMAAGGSTFGQRQPPLYISIQKILDKYPDGQIFKVSTGMPVYS